MDQKKQNKEYQDNLEWELALMAAEENELYDQAVPTQQQQVIQKIDSPMREEQQIPSRSKLNDDDEEEAVGWIRENDAEQDFNYDDADMDGWGDDEDSPQLILQNASSTNEGKNNDTVEAKVLN